MKQSIKLKTTTLLVIPLVLACFALLPRAQAATPELLPAPAPDGFYKGFNTAEGLNALFNLTTGTFNSAFGFSALKADTTGGSNTAVGAQALLHNNTGGYNTAVGENALVFNTSGSFNMALGQGALANNLIGNNNTAMGFQALNHNTVDDNTAVGHSALFFNTTGTENTAVGFQALLSNTTGFVNAAYGSFALGSNTTGHRNTATGGAALPANTIGFRNTGTGFASLLNNSTGNLNTATGWSSLTNNSKGSFNIALGYKAGQNLTGDNNIDVGNLGGAGEANTIRIGNQVAGTDDVGFPHPAHTATYIAGIAGVNQGSPAAVYINTTTGQLGTQAPASSLRFKHDIKAMDKTSDAILALKPVTFHYKSDTKNTPQFGLIAEQVAKVNPDLVVRDEKGEIYSVRYDAVNAMLLNEFLKEHRKVQELKNDFQATVARQQKEIQALTAALKEQAAQIQKVSAQLEVNKPAPQTVLNNQ